jgi:GNAT superfamily N-acetyltransferase
MKREILDTMVPDGTVFAMFHAELAACASICDIDAFRPHATLMFVLVHPAHRSRGLGSAVTAHAIYTAHRVGFPGIILHTQDFRLPAVRTYLKLGFQPETTVPGTAERWESVLDEIRRVSR